MPSPCSLPTVPFSQLLIIGTGLLGTSIALAAKERKLVKTVIGVDCSRQHLDAALSCGAIDLAFPDIFDIASLENTLAVVCTAVSTLETQVKRVLNHAIQSENFLVTDVGSTKASLCRAVDDPRFIGSHPIAGSEQSGPTAARADLFENRVVILTPTPRHSADDLERLSGFWTALGSQVVTMTPERHDEILAITSHLPHLLSAVLASTLQESERPFTGAGYASMTRLSNGLPSLWRDILQDNAENVLTALRRFERRLTEFTALLESQDAERIEEFLEQAQKR